MKVTRPHTWTHTKKTFNKTNSRDMSRMPPMKKVREQRGIELKELMTTTEQHHQGQTENRLTGSQSQ